MASDMPAESDAGGLENKAESTEAPMAEADSAANQADSASDKAAADTDSVRPAGGGTLATEADGFNRKVVYRGTVTMEVDDFGAAYRSLQNAIYQSGGYILAFSDNRSPDETGAVYTIKVPADGFMPFLDRLEKIENALFERQLKGTDVTEEYVDLEARLKARQMVEARLIGFMDKAARADDLLRFSEQLGAVQEEIERIKGRIRYLDQNVAFSTIELRLYQPLTPAASALAAQKPLFGRMGAALETSTETLLLVMQALLVFVAGALPVLILFAVVGTSFLWLYRRRRRLQPFATGSFGTAAITGGRTSAADARQAGETPPAHEAPPAGEEDR
ncbi:MAG TPA: DUF4349 domain-containing protein [Paenibacillus sp.]|uniref:DUF4349 domain-containing protein n=1 Tax=Paenibacillus sp. TaxID=58172 RepID=UPI002BCC828A|nr:DUF4349 domain-containing protein [Paenibacillus sp.]HUC91317.1 DUF4349 domain-containing protein [Paenibacillus sp.]